MLSKRYRATTWGLGLAMAGWILVGFPGCCNRGPALFCCGHQTERDYGHSVNIIWLIHW